MTAKKYLQDLADQINNLSSLNLKIEYSRTYGGYAITKDRNIPRELRFIVQDNRMTANEMQAYLIGILNGIRLSREQLFNSNAILFY